MTLPYDQGAMLASPGKNPDEVLKNLLKGGRHVYDLKHDGVRVLAFIDNGVVRLKNRNGVDTTDRFPEVVERLAELFPTGQRVFDGEMICFDPETGKPTFARISKRDRTGTLSKQIALAKSMPATYMTFDLLWFNGDDLRPHPLMARLALLKTDSMTFGDDARVMLSLIQDDGAAFWRVVKDHGLEGLIAKDRLAPYRSGRAPAWVKLKPTFSLSAIVLGYTPGQGARAGRIGALALGLLYDGEIKPFGEVGTGFTDKELAYLQPKIDAGEMLLVDIEVQNITPDGKPRFPSYRGVRMDISILDCDAKQLADMPVC